MDAARTELGLGAGPLGLRESEMKRTLFALALVVITLAGCVVVPARPAYYRPAPVVIY